MQELKTVNWDFQVTSEPLFPPHPPLYPEAKIGKAGFGRVLLQSKATS